MRIEYCRSNIANDDHDHDKNNSSALCCLTYSESCNSVIPE